MCTSEFVFLYQSIYQLYSGSGDEHSTQYNTIYVFFIMDQAIKKKKLIADGKLGKFGKPNENTPEDWNKEHPHLG